MLLRSSSNPVLESLLGCPSELFPDHTKLECPASETSALPRSLSLSSRCCSSSSTIISNCLSNLDHPANSSGPPPFAPLRKVLSENDLCSFAAGSSESPSQVVANSLCHDSSDPYARSHHLNVKKDRTSLRWRSLASFPLDLLVDSGSAILEEGESVSANSSATSEDGEEKGGDVCSFDKLALPVGRASSIATERRTDEVGNDDDHVVNDEDVKTVDVVDVGFDLNMAEDTRSWKNPPPKMEMQGVGGGQGSLEMNTSNCSSDASSFGRQEPVYMVGNRALHSSERREGSAGTRVLVPQVHGETPRPRYVYHGDAWEEVHGAGDGGRGARPPTSAGGRGGQGWPGGYGGRNSDPTELHYQTVLKDDPGHALILQNYAQYLAEVKHDYRKAEEFFQRAILANPSDGELLSQYAKMLWEGQQDRDRAASYFERAVQAAPDNSYVVAAYASFLWSAEEEEEQESLEEVQGSNPSNVPAGVFSLVSAGLA